jgi:DNA-binding winged helix-turn-helix (wHTH) protein
VSLKSVPPVIYRFGLFEVDPHSGEVRKGGIKIKLQEQPFQVLLKLLEQAGNIVSRDDLRATLWKDDTFVDFDAGLNTVIRRLRDTLGDSADNPTLIETVPRRGYRLIAPVDKSVVPDSADFRQGVKTRGWRLFIRPAWLSVGVLLFALAIFALLTARSSPPAGNPLRFVQLTNDGLAKSGGLLSDGTRVYFSEAGFGTGFEGRRRGPPGSHRAGESPPARYLTGRSPNPGGDGRRGGTAAFVDAAGRGGLSAPGWQHPGQ